MNLSKKIGNISTRFLFNRVSNINTPTPLISFTFDDFPLSAYSIGGKILTKYKARGTFYISTKFVDGTSPCGEAINSNDLKNLLKEGHEIGCHTYDHLDAENNTALDFKNSIRKNQDELNNTLGFHYQLKHFAYPFGHLNVGVKKIISKNFLTARGTTWGINKWLFDLNALKACKLYGSLKLQPNIEDTIRENAKLKGWVIFYTHDVSDSPSKFGCTPELLEYTISLAFENNIKIKTINEVISSFLFNK